jgi:aromatic-amino-acid transaminase
MTVPVALTRHPSPFADIPAAPPDPILGLTEAFNADTNPGKVNLGVGVYQNENGKVPVLKAVREAEARWYQQEDSKSYLPIEGVAALGKQVQKLLFGENSPVLSEGPTSTSAIQAGKTIEPCLRMRASQSKTTPTTIRKRTTWISRGC